MSAAGLLDAANDGIHAYSGTIEAKIAIQRLGYSYPAVTIDRSPPSNKAVRQAITRRNGSAVLHFISAPLRRGGVRRARARR